MDDDKTIPYGYCHCGCGEKTNLSKVTRAGQFGKPNRFLSGHNMVRDALERFWEKVDKDAANGCWEWTAALRNGYAHFGPRSGQFVYGHRWAYEQLVGPIPEGLQLDHLCRNRACVNPAHLEPVTHRENVRRGIPHRRTA